MAGVSALKVFGLLEGVAFVVQQLGHPHVALWFSLMVILCGFMEDLRRWAGSDAGCTPASCPEPEVDTRPWRKSWVVFCGPAHRCRAAEVMSTGTLPQSLGAFTVRNSSVKSYVRTTTTTTTTQVFAMFMCDHAGAASLSSARRRRERAMGAALRHERLSIAVHLAEALHHVASHR